MKINKIKSNTFRVIAGVGAISFISVMPNLRITSNFVNYAKAEQQLQPKSSIELNDDMFESQLSQEERDFNYLNNVNSADLSEYDEEFLDFYHNGKIYIEGQEEPINVSQLLIISRDNDDSVEYHVVSYKDMTYDIINDCDISMFERDYLMDFMNSNCFYDFYLVCKENGCLVDNSVYLNDENRAQIQDALKSYDKTMHDKAPETYYLKTR